MLIIDIADFQIERNRSPQGWLAVTYPFGKPLYQLEREGLRRAGFVRFVSLGAALDWSAFLSHLMNKGASRVYRIASHDEARELTVRLITRFQSRLRSRGVRFGVVVLPAPDDFTAEARRDREVVAGALRRAEIPVLVPDFPRLADGRIDPKRFLVSTEDRHPNRLYSELLAEQVTRFLRDRLLYDES